jgi:hypothetical protein
MQHSFINRKLKEKIEANPRMEKNTEKGAKRRSDKSEINSTLIMPPTEPPPSEPNPRVEKNTEKEAKRRSEKSKINSTLIMPMELPPSELAIDDDTKKGLDKKKLSAEKVNRENSPSANTDDAPIADIRRGVDRDDAPLASADDTLMQNDDIAVIPPRQPGAEYIRGVTLGVWLVLRPAPISLDTIVRRHPLVSSCHVGYLKRNLLGKGLWSWQFPITLSPSMSNFNNTF